MSPGKGPQGDGASLNAGQGIGPRPLRSWTRGRCNHSLSQAYPQSFHFLVKSQSPQPLTASLLPVPDRDMEAQGTGKSWPSGACKARDPPATLCFLLTLALARGILESLRLCCSYGKACRNHVIWSLAQTLARLISQVSGPTCQWPGRVTDP